MGHLLSTKSSLVPLIDRLNRYPIGLVDSTKLREILTLLFTEQEAFVASRFPLHEATAATRKNTRTSPAARAPRWRTSASKARST
ncbi:hypothetical protein [uncultured Lamprocystis sp.]|jgi:hypothetical protein|uniref:hypothetical protein n=1 Tax=uncultured Lamprocystis sp. TaxID=543132 RepID=UPI0025DD86C3|nr:hypothetical protein [uncultured Lamprocystis sp.]